MNKLTIIGNLTRDPEMRITQSGKSVCTFTVAVNKRNGDAEFFRVTAWEERGKVCEKYLSKGKKVCVVGPVGVSTYQANDGSTKASLEVTADDVEFLRSRTEGNGYEQVNVDELPFEVMR